MVVDGPVSDGLLSAISITMSTEPACTDTILMRDGSMPSSSAMFCTS
jgi:hypothetical protein